MPIDSKNRWCLLILSLIKPDVTFKRLDKLSWSIIIRNVKPKSMRYSSRHTSSQAKRISSHKINTFSAQIINGVEEKWRRWCNQILYKPSQCIDLLPTCSLAIFTTSTKTQENLNVAPSRSHPTFTYHRIARFEYIFENIYCHTLRYFHDLTPCSLKWREKNARQKEERTKQSSSMVLKIYFLLATKKPNHSIVLFHEYTNTSFSFLQRERV